MLKAFFLGLTALGAACAAFGVYFILYSQEAGSWPTVEGRIVSTAVRAHTPRRGSTTLTPSERERRRRYYPEVTYTWTVDGRTFEGSRFSLGEGLPDHGEREQAEAAARAFRPGAPIAVFYDPAEPSSAVLDRSQKWGAFVPLPLGLLMLAAGVGGWLKLPALQAAAAQRRRDHSVRA